MSNLATQYLGLLLRTPLVASASPLSETLDGIKRLEDAGIAAIVLHSLFEEQLTVESLLLQHHLEQHADCHAEALSYFPEPTAFRVGPEEYLEHLERAKRSVQVPLIASLNGTTVGNWTRYASQLQQAGADALELNFYALQADASVPPHVIEDVYVEIVREVRAAVSLPLAVKLSPFHTSLAYTARRLVEAGAQGLVLFNRFYQPDIDLDLLEVHPQVILSTSVALRLPLRWIAILFGQLDADLAATSGIHSPQDVLKVLMAGARASMLCSILLKRGVEHVQVLEQGLHRWLEEHEYESVRQLQGSMSQAHCPDPTAFERAQYVRALQTFRLDPSWRTPGT